MADTHSISFVRDEQGVKIANCSCGWSFWSWSVPLNPDSVVCYNRRATSIKFDTAVADHERQHANGKR